jgi:predicted porin
MKKSLIALAVLAASGASFAQSSVSIYGLLDVSLAHVKAGDVTTNSMLSGAVSTSVWGFKGSEDLGGGLKANFKLEQGFNIDDGTAKLGANNTNATTFSRESWVGLSGGFGEVKLGKVSSAYNDIEGVAAPVFGSGTVGPMGVAFQTDIQENARPSNTVYYSTPTFSGFTGSASFSLDEKTATATVTGQKVNSLAGSYAAGPLYVGLGYQTQQDYNSTTAPLQVKLSQLNVTYDLTVVKLIGALGHVTNSNGIEGKANEWLIGVDVPVTSALTLSAGYSHSKTDGTTNTGAATSLVDVDFKQSAFSIGAAYSLSKRTLVYVAAETDKITDKGNGADDLTTDRYAVGIKHSF